MNRKNKLLITMMLCVGYSASAHAALIFNSMTLLTGALSNQSIYGKNTVTLGANTDAGGNISGFSAISTGAKSVVGGTISSGTAVTTGAGSITKGDIMAGTSVSTGSGSLAEGNIIAGEAFTGGVAAPDYNDVSNPSIVDGEVKTGEQYTQSGAGTVAGIPAGDPGGYEEFLKYEEVGGVRTNSNPLDLSYVDPAFPDQESQLTLVQQALSDMGYANAANTAPGDTLKGSTTPIQWDTFGTNDEYLTAGIYDAKNYLTIAAGKTLTLDGENKKGDFLFNIHNYLDFAAGAQVVLVNFDEDSRIIWNVIGDAAGSSGYAQLGADVNLRGFILARGYVDTGADTTIFGVGDLDCGGAISVQNYVGFGARNTIGADGCAATFIRPTTPMVEPGSVLLFGLGLIGLVGVARRKKV